MLWQHVGAWFRVQGGTSGAILSEDVVSLSISEEMGQVDRFSLKLLDRSLTYADVCSPGNAQTVSWGLQNPQMRGFVPRSVLTYVSSLSGSGEESGKCTVNVELTAVGEVTDGHNESFTSGTRKALVTRVMTEQLKILPANQHIAFDSENRAFSDRNGVNQSSNAFKFLTVKSAEWDAYFRLGYDTKGFLHGFFGSPDKLPLFTRACCGTTSAYLAFGSLKTKDEIRQAYAMLPPGAVLANVVPNVKSYTWKCNLGNVGSGCTFDINADGSPNFTRYDAGQQKIVVYRIDPDRVKEAIQSRPEFRDQAEFVWAMMQPSVPWSEKEPYFNAEVMETPPEGIGYEVSVRLMGDPTVTAGTIFNFGSGFPMCLSSKQQIWFAKKCTHTFSNGGYFTDVDIVDSFYYDVSGIARPDKALIPEAAM